MHTFRILALTTSLIALGCSGKTDGQTEDSGTTKTDSGDTEPQYEEGCILVDGEGGYKWLEDALEVAEEGSTVSLCEGEMDMSIELEGSVNLVGPGPDLLQWTAETNRPAIKVTGGSKVTLSGFSVSSTRNGIEIENSEDVTLSDIRFINVLGTGVRSINSSGTSIDGCEFLQAVPEEGGDTGLPPEDTGEDTDTATPEEEPTDSASSDTGDTDTASEETEEDPGDGIPYVDNPIGYGGVEISGGTASVANSRFVQMVGFAIHGINSGEITASDNEVYYTVYGEPDADGNVSDGFALWVEDGSILNTSNNLLGGNFVGVFADEGDLNLSGDEILGGAYGAFAINGAFSVDGVKVENPFTQGLRLQSANQPIVVSNTTVWGDPDVVASGEDQDGASTGMFLASPEVSVSDTTVYGWNYMGMQVVPFDSDINATLTNVTIDNAGTMGLYAAQGSFDLTDVNIINFRTPYDPYTDDGASISSGFASSFWYSDVTWTGGSIKDSAFIGTLAAFSSLTVDGIDVEGNANQGMWIYESTAAISNSNFTRSSSTGGVVSSSGDLTMTGNTFQDNLETYYYEGLPDSNGSVFSYTRDFQSQDIVSYSGTRLDVKNNTFSNGSEGIQIFGGSNTVIEGNTWENYNRNAIYASSTADSVEVKDNTGTNIGAYFLYCSSSAVEMSSTSVDGAAGSAYKTTYYSDGVETSSYESTWYDPIVYGYNCTFYGEELDFRNSAERIAKFYDSSTEIYDSVFHSSATESYNDDGSLDLSWSGQAPNFIANNIDIYDAAVGHGLRLASTATTAGTISLSNISVDGVAGSGVRLENIDSETDADGNYSTTLSDITTSNNKLGLESINSKTSLSGLTASGNSYGMTCDTTTAFSPCESIDLTGNTDGEHQGCLDACEAITE